MSGTDRRGFLKQLFAAVGCASALAIPVAAKELMEKVPLEEVAKSALDKTAPKAPVWLRGGKKFLSADWADGPDQGVVRIVDTGTGEEVHRKYARADHVHPINFDPVQQVEKRYNPDTGEWSVDSLTIEQQSSLDDGSLQVVETRGHSNLGHIVRQWDGCYEDPDAYPVHFKDIVRGAGFDREHEVRKSYRIPGSFLSTAEYYDVTRSEVLAGLVSGKLKMADYPKDWEKLTLKEYDEAMKKQTPRVRKEFQWADSWGGK